MEFIWARAQESLLKVLRESTLADAYCAGHFPFIARIPVEPEIAVENPSIVQ